MSTNTIERVLYDLHAIPGDARSFLQDPDAYLAKYPLDAEERSLIRNQDVLGMADRGVSQMLMFVTWQAVNGGPSSIPEYMRRMNTPAGQANAPA